MVGAYRADGQQAMHLCHHFKAERLAIKMASYSTKGTPPLRRLTGRLVRFKRKCGKCSKIYKLNLSLRRRMSGNTPQRQCECHNSIEAAKQSSHVNFCSLINTEEGTTDICDPRSLTLSSEADLKNCKNLHNEARLFSFSQFSTSIVDLLGKRVLGVFETCDDILNDPSMKVHANVKTEDRFRRCEEIGIHLSNRRYQRCDVYRYVKDRRKKCDDNLTFQREVKRRVMILIDSSKNVAPVKMKLLRKTNSSAHS